MDSQWQLSKCGSTCQSSAEQAKVVAQSPVSQVQSHDSTRNSMMNPSHYYNPHISQEPCSSTHKLMPDPLFQATNINLYNSSLSVMGTSFFTLLSGPPASFSKYDSQQVLSSKPSNPSSKIHVYSTSSIVGPTQCETSFATPKVSSHNIDNRYLKSKVDVFPVSDSGNTTGLHDILQARKVNGFSSLRPAPICGASASASATPVPSPIKSGLPRVFCLYASGDLFLSSSGLLGVVCSCHGFRMSISKFSEHAGLQDINPGDAVHMDSGETIAQWRKVYFSKIGIRIPEDQHGWHWPQTPPDLINKKTDRIHNISTTSIISKSATPFNNMVFPNKHHSSHNLVNQILSHQAQSTNGNKIMEQLVSMSTISTIDPIYNTKNPFTFQNNLQSIRNLGNDSHKLNNVKAAVSSNIELRLGQPSQQPNPKLYNGSNRITEESKQFVDCAAEAAKSSSIEGQNQMRFSNLGFGAYSTRTTVMNPHPPSLGVKYINHDDMSSSCGFGQDQIVPANSLNQILKNSITFPPKLTGETDGNCCQGTTPCSYVPGKTSISAFGEPSQIRNSLLSGSNLEKDCSLHGGFIPSDKIGETVKKPNLKKIEVNAFQWKDVPSKISGRCKDQNDVIDQGVEKVDFMKEQVMSNVSSKCSLTQASVKISNGDSCTDDAHNTDCVKNFAVDESSGIQKSFSDDDALDSASKVNFKDGIRSTRSLIDELRVIDSFRLKKAHENNTSSMNTFEKDGKRKGETKFKVIDPVLSLSTGSSGQSSQSMEDVDTTSSEEFSLPCKKPKRGYDDCLEIREGKKKMLDFDSDFSKRKRIIRPVVCGRYGLISNGDTSKPAKIFSLGKILKTSKRCNPTPSGNKVVKKTPEKVSKKPRIKQGNRRSGRLSSFKDDNYHISQETEDHMETSKDTDTSYLFKNGSENSNEKIHCIPRRKSKEVRIRSLYDLIAKGNDSNFASVPEDNLNIKVNCEELTITKKSTEDMDTFCHVCRGLNNDEINCLLECNRCSIKVHQACYGVSKLPKTHWHCRPCRDNATNMACVLCGYEGGVMTRAIHTTNIVTTLLNTWNVVTQSQSTVVNSVTAGFFDPTVKQWVHMVCGLWTPGTRCPNVDTMSTFDVSGASSHPNENTVCSMCKRGGGCCIRCRVIDCVVDFHPWCAHQKGLLQSEVEGAENESVGFYGRCELHATNNHVVINHNKTNNNSDTIKVVKKDTCARTEGYKGRKREGFRHGNEQNRIVRQEQVDAWNYINQQLLFKKRIERTTQVPVQDVESDPRKEYARYKQSKGWKHLVVYKSGIHALGLYTSLFISQSEMVVEYIGEIVGTRVADRRESEYESGKQLQYKSACYFFRIDKEHIIDATRKGGIARFVNHSCQPNCVAKVITVRGEKKVVFFAERDIYPGEEITYDYHFNNEDEGKKILCSCNSNNCRRYLN